MTDNIQRTDSVHKPDTFTKNQFAWLRQVAADEDLPPTASRVAIALTSYFNREQDGIAWMKQVTLAADLGVSERTVRDALSDLVDRGHLTSKRRGFNDTNEYKAVLKVGGDGQKAAGPNRQDTAGPDRRKSAGQTGKSASSDRQDLAGQTGSTLPPNPLTEPLEEPNGEIDSLSLDLGDEDFGRRSLRSPADMDAEFEVWFRHYPKRVAKAAAAKAYSATRTRHTRGRGYPEEVTAEVLLSGAMRYAAERSGQDPRYTKHPATWLNGGCWADEPAMPAGDSSVRYAATGGVDHIANGAAMARQVIEDEYYNVQ